jgi:carbon-monoxide dehydrogenase catalytic subunit
VTGAPVFHDYLFEEMEKHVRRQVGSGSRSHQACPMMIAHIDKKRKELGIDKARERVLMDMADRQKLEA